MQPDKYISSYVNILLRLFHNAHIVGISLSQYLRIAKTINGILHKIKHDYGLYCVTIVIYRVSVITNYSFGPTDKTLTNEIVNEGCVITKLNIIDVCRTTSCLVNV